MTALERIRRHVDHLTTITTAHTEHLDAIRHTITQLERWQPGARAYADQGDGLHSPSLHPGRGGGHSDSVGNLAAHKADLATSGPIGNADRLIEAAALSLLHAIRAAQAHQPPPDPAQGHSVDLSGLSGDDGGRP